MRTRGRLSLLSSSGLLACAAFAGACATFVSACAPAAPSAPDKVGGRGGALTTANSVPSPEPSSSAQPDPDPRGTAQASATPSPPAAPMTSASAAPPAGASALPPPIPPNTVVLHIGDSFLLAGFAQALKPRMKSLGVRYEVRSEQSSYTTSWAGKMERLVANTQPDLVIINLGANEVSNTDPPTHAPAVRRIVKGIGGRPCVWVSPPLWRKDTGIIDVIREHSAPCRFFDSDLLVTEPIPRISDKIHPTIDGGAMWAAAFWQWLEAQRAPADASPPELLPSGPSSGSAPPRRNPWLLRPSPPEEHRPLHAAALAGASAGK